MIKLFLIPLICNVLFSAFASDNIAEETYLAKQTQAALYVIGYKIAPENWQTVMDEDIEYRLNFPPAEQIDFADFEQLFQVKEHDKAPLKRYQEYSLPTEFCTHNQKGSACLKHVRKNKKLINKAITSQPRMWSQVDHLIQATKTLKPSDLKLPVPDEHYSLNFEFPQYQWLVSPLLTRNALTFVDDAELGMKKTCDSIRLGKSLIASGEQLIQSMIGSNIVVRQLDLLKTMKDESGNDLPSECQDTLKPLPTENISMCLLANSELQFSNNMNKAFRDSKDFNQKKAFAISKAYWGLTCSTEWTNEVNKDIRRKLQAFIPDKTMCEGNEAFCQMFIEQYEMFDGYAFYQHRLQDANAYLKLWQQATTSNCDERLLKEEWGNERQFTLKNKNLSIKTYNVSQWQSFSLPCLTQP